MSGGEWYLVQAPSDAWFLAHWSELGLWPYAKRKRAPSSSVTLTTVTEVVQRIERRRVNAPTPTWLEN